MGTRTKRRKSRSRPTTTDQPTPPPSRRRRRRNGPSPADWAALPSRILLEILSRVPQADILRGAGLACASWRRAAAHEPLLWRHISLAGAEEEDISKGAPPGWRAASHAAVDRSAGRCASFRGPVDADFLLYLAHRSPSLRRLHVTSCFDYMSNNKEDEQLFRRVVRKLPLLEQVVLSGGLFGREQIGALLDHCPHLRLLDAGGCATYTAIGTRFLERCESSIEELRMPRFLGGDCSYCTT